MGQLGCGSTVEQYIPQTVPLPEGTVVKSLEGGEIHVICLTTEGEVFCWGINDEGQLGLGNTWEEKRRAMMEDAEVLYYENMAEEKEQEEEKQKAEAEGRKVKRGRKKTTKKKGPVYNNDGFQFFSLPQKLAFDEKIVGVSARGTHSHFISETSQYSCGMG